jgi:extradiol dioxygenase family protein
MYTSKNLGIQAGIQASTWVYKQAYGYTSRYTSDHLVIQAGIQVSTWVYKRAHGYTSRYTTEHLGIQAGIQASTWANKQLYKQVYKRVPLMEGSSKDGRRELTGVVFAEERGLITTAMLPREANGPDTKPVAHVKWKLTFINDAD